MVICPRCGKLTDGGSAACPACGQPLAVQPAMAPPVLRPPVLAQGPPSSQSPQPPAPFGVGSLANVPQITYPACLVCGYSFSQVPQAVQCPRCKAPRGFIADPNDVTSNRYVLFAGAPVVLAPDQIFTSQSFTPSVVTQYPRVGGWNWGAATWSVSWSARHKQWAWSIACAFNLLFWLLIAALIPPSTLSPSAGKSDSADSGVVIFEIVLALSSLFWIIKTLYLGANGNTIAMRSGLYIDEAEMRNSQKSRYRRGAIIGIAMLFALLFEIIWASMH